MSQAITVKNLCVAYSNIEAVNNINLEINKGEFVSVIGPNGGGKTTLLNTLLGFLKPYEGEVIIHGSKKVEKGNVMSYVPQVADIDRDFPITVLEAVMTSFLKNGLHPFRRFTQAERQKALFYLKEVGLEDYGKRQLNQLSGGEFQRLLIARALIGEPQILLLDEPTANVDIASRDKIFELLGRLNKDGMTIITVTHDLSAAIELSSKLVCINRTLVYCGEPHLNDAVARTMYGGRSV